MRTVDLTFIKETVFNTVDFTYNEDIQFFEYDGIKVNYDGQTAKIGANTKAGFARGCFLFALNFSEGKTSINICEKANFKNCGSMIDCSRNAVITPDAAKRYINCMAALGFNFLMLYTEDTFTIEGRPRFGYLRGRYSKEEIRDIIEYGDKMGIELVPCIQTLGHMLQYLKWSRAGAPDYTGEHIWEITDKKAVLLCDCEETYRFIEDAVRTCRECFKSKRIHIGMDEASDMGLGNYLRLNGFQNRFEILTKHLKRVVKICQEYQFEPIIWSDMIFNFTSKNHTYYEYDFEFPKNLKESISQVGMVFWDYYHNDQNFYENMLKKHMELGDNITFAGAIHTFMGFLVAHNLTYRNMEPALRACLTCNVETVVATLWGDDGNETNVFLSTSLLPLYSEYCYRGFNCTEEDIARVSAFLTKIDFRDAQVIGNLTYDTNKTMEGFIVGKRLFYADILYDLSIEQDACDEAITVYNECADRLSILIEKHDRNYERYQYAQLLYRICSIKAELRKNLRQAYQNGDLKYLEKASQDIMPRLIKYYKELSECHKKQWKTTYKPFGYEVLSFRYGGVIARVEDTIEVISQYLQGEIPYIAELEEKLLINEGGYSVVAKEIITPSADF